MEKMTKVQKVKAHLKRNKGKYITGSVCLAVGAVGGAVLVKKLGCEIDNSNTLMNQALLNIKPTIVQQNTYVTNLVRRGHAGNVIRCVETGELFASQNRAASACGVNPATLSSHLKGKLENAGGYTFEKVGDFNSQE